MIINLIYLAQFDTNGILTALYSHTVHTNAIRAHMNMHETIIFEESDTKAIPTQLRHPLSALQCDVYVLHSNTYLAA